MTAEDRTHRYALRLQPPTKLHGLAVDVLSRSLGLDRAEAAARLDVGTVVGNLRADHANRLKSLLSAAGLPAATGPAGSAGRMDLSVQLAVWADLRRVARRLATVLNTDAAIVAADLVRPGGLVFPSLHPAEHARLTGLIAPVRGTVLISSDPATALYDIHAARPFRRAESERVSRALRLLGSVEDPLTGALATDLSQAQCKLLLARLPDLGLFALDRAFQRFDLLLTGTTGWVTRDLADFLAGRTHQPRARFETISPSAPVKIDLGLTRSVARQFCADYAAIGLFVRPVLSGHARNP